MNRAATHIAPGLAALALSLVLALSGFGCSASSQPQRQPLPGPQAQQEQQARSTLSFEELCDDLFEYEATWDNLTLNQLVADPEGAGIEVPRPATLGDLSPEALDQEIRVYSEAHRALADERVIDRSGLTDSQLIEAEALEARLMQALEYERYFYYLEPFSPSTGWQASLPFSLMDYNFRTVDDIEIYLELLEDVPRLFGQLVAFEEVKRDKQLLQSREAMEAAIREARTYAAASDHHILTASFDEMIDEAYADAVAAEAAGDVDAAAISTGLGSLSPEQVDAYKTRNKDAIDAFVAPAYADLVASLESILPACLEGTRLCDYPEGAAYYALGLRSMGFTEDPASAAAILDSALDGYWAVVEANATGNDWYGAIEDEVVRSLGESPEGYVTYLQACSAADFADLGAIDYAIKTAPEASPNDYSCAYFRIPPVDDAQANTIVYFPKNIPDYSELYSTMAHECYPGHMYQFYAHELEGLAPISKMMRSTAYTEGWAVYIESYAIRYLDADPAAEEAYIAYKKFLRALESRIDIGVNYEGWSVGDVDAYLAGWGFGEGYGRDWYYSRISNPMSILSYGLGVIKFDELHLQAQQLAGPAFDAIAYHQKVMATGPVSFDILEREVIAAYR